MKSRIKGKRELIHPIFLECRDRCDNDFWKLIFEDIAYGRYPKQFYINQNQQINSTSRINQFTYSFRDKTVNEMVHEIQELLLQHTNLISNEEIDIKKNNIIPFKKDVWESWKDIKKKYIKDILIMDYCIEIKKTMSLSLNETTHLYIILNNLITFGYLYEVQLDNYKIISINGVSVLPHLNVIYINYDYSKEDVMYPIPDNVSHYSKKHLLRTTKLINQTKAQPFYKGL
jgi:hypothetical protein